MIQQCDLALMKSGGILGCTGKHVASRLEEVILPLSSALLKPYVQYCVQFWSAQYKRDLHILESPMWSHQDGEGTGAPLLRGEAESWDCSAWRRLKGHHINGNKCHGR